MRLYPEVDQDAEVRTVVVTACPRADDDAVTKLTRFGVATVHEAIGSTGYLGPAIRPVYLGSRIGGTAVTVVCWPGDNLMIHCAVEQCQPGDVLVVTTTSPSSDGAFGELLATSLQHRGVRGLVTTGGVRDVSELHSMGFPVFCSAVSAQGTVKATAGAVNVPVSINGQRIAPGDAILADDDGALVVPRSDRRLGRSGRPGTRRTRKMPTRAAFRGGELGLDRYGLRAVLSRARRGIPGLPRLPRAAVMSRAGSGVAVAALGIRCMLMRGGTSKGLYFLASELPEQPALARRSAAPRSWVAVTRYRSTALGGAHPLTSKVGRHLARRTTTTRTSTISSCSSGSTRPTVTDQQNCGNILAGVGPFAVERGLIEPGRESTTHSHPDAELGQRSRPPTFSTPGGVPITQGTPRSRACRARQHRSGCSSPTPSARLPVSLLPTGQHMRRHRRHRGHLHRQRHAGRRRPCHRAGHHRI